MVLYLKGKIISKKMLREEVWNSLKKERKTELMPSLEEGIYNSSNEEEALNFISRYFDVR